MHAFLWSVCFQGGAKTEDDGFKLTEHASASTGLNYHMIKFIRAVALKVRVGINVWFKDDCAKHGLIVQPQENQ